MDNISSDVVVNPFKPSNAPTNCLANSISLSDSLPLDRDWETEDLI